MSDDEFDTNAERNEMSVVLSEEVSWLEELADRYEHDLPADVLVEVIARRDAVREVMKTANDAERMDEAEEGTPLPEEDDEPEA